MTDFIDAASRPLRLIVRLSYPASRLGPEKTIDEWVLTDIRKSVPIIRRQSSRSASVAYQGPIQISLLKQSADGNYSLFKGCLVTCRFRRLQGGPLE